MQDFSFKFEGDFKFLVNFFFVRFNFKGISFVKLKPIFFFVGENGKKSNLREFLIKGAFFDGDHS